MQPCTLWRQITITRGSNADYEALAQFHYRAGRPIAVTRIFVARFRDPPPHAAARPRPAQVAGVLVETRPVLNCAARNRATHCRYLLPDKRAAARLLNREITTIARVIVHPAFRGIGVAKALVAHALRHAATPCVEARAAMGIVQPFFERAGMQPFPGPRHKPVYYFWQVQP